MTYRDRIAVVTGAGSGIGRELTLGLTRGGATVAAADIDPEGLAATQEMCSNGQVSTYQLDVADRQAVLDFAGKVRADLGPASMVFNNAGVDVMASIADTSWADLDWLTGINIGGVVNGTKAFLPQLIESGSPARPARLVNLSSAFGLVGMPLQGAYCMSKFAVRGFTETLRQELIMERHPVTAHCVHPGVVRTNFGANARTEDAEFVKLFDRVARTTPTKAAQIILRGVEKNRARILIGADGWISAAIPRLLGASYSGLLGRGARLGNRG